MMIAIENSMHKNIVNYKFYGEHDINFYLLIVILSSLQQLAIKDIEVIIISND